MAIYMPDLILFYILPLILIVVLYSLIGITLRESTLAMSKINGREDRLSTRSAVQRLVKDPAVSESGGGDNLIIKGDNQVIRALNDAVPGMAVGGLRRISVTPQNGWEKNTKSCDGGPGGSGAGGDLKTDYVVVPTATMVEQEACFQF